MTARGWTSRLRSIFSGRGPAAPTTSRGVQISYAPKHDGRPDPGEVVWAWVPFEDDPSQGKDRPVLLIGRQGGRLLGLYLTSKDHDRDATQEARAGRYWMDIGTGDWDRERRPSEVRLNRLVSVSQADVRREGAAVSKQVFDAVIAAARPFHPELASP